MDCLQPARAVGSAVSETLAQSALLRERAMTLKHCCRGPTACTHPGQAITEREREREMEIEKGRRTER